MTSTNNASFSLLDQKEIDALVQFLLDKKDALDSDVMSQNSIDKLIMLIKTDKEKLSTYFSLAYANFDTSILKKLKFKMNEDEKCILKFDIDEDTKFISLELTNTTTGKTMNLLPKHFNESDSELWGLSMAPVLFTHLARTLAAKFSQETYDKVCDCFVMHQYGSLSYPIPSIYLPENFILLECIE